jgi:hypothetical protein
MKQRFGPEQSMTRQRLLAPLARLRRRARLYLAVQGIAAVALWLVALVAFQLLLDRWLRFSLDQRAVLGVCLLLAIGSGVFRRLLRPLQNPLTDRILAAAVDRRNPHLADRITTAVELSADPGDAEFNSPELVCHVIREACAQSDEAAFLGVLDHRRARRRGRDLALLLAVMAGAWIVAPATMSTWFERNVLLRETPWPQATYIVPVGFDALRKRRGARGDELVIVADSRGVVPRSATLHWRDEAGHRGELAMSLIGDSRWRVSLGVQTESVLFHISGGDERTADYTVAAIDRPRVDSIAARIAPPAYTGQAPVELARQTVLEMPSGSSIVIEAALNKRVAAAEFVGGDGVVGVCELIDSGAIRWRTDAPVSGSYSFALTDHDGFKNRRPVRFTLKVLPDQPPELEIEVPGVSDVVTPASRFPVRLIASDTFGLSRLVCYAQRDEHPPMELTIDGFAPGVDRLERTVPLDLISLGVEPGQRLAIFAQAADTDPAGPNVNRTDPIVLRVLSTTDFAAELAQRELELRQEFERLISAQLGLREVLVQLLPGLAENEPPTDAQSQQLAGLVRRQETHVKSTGSVADRFDDIVNQMRIGRIARAADERRISQGIVDPLRQLSAVRMRDATRGIAGLRARVVPLEAREAVQSQAEIVHEMRAVLERMLEWEGYREAVALLTDIIDQQTGIHEATVDALEGQLEDILGLEIPPDQSPADAPKP